jgi:hypothetical protein
MILPATYQNGFAPRDGQPLYPSLWKGCVGAWNPGLGPTGLTLRDQSGFGNNGTLTNGPTWVASQGKYALDFDGVNDNVIIPKRPSVGNATASVWLYPRTYTLYGGAVDDNFNLQGGLSIAWSHIVNKIMASFKANSFPYGSLTTSVVTLNKWVHIAVTRIGATNLIYADGISGVEYTGLSGDSNPPRALTIGSLDAATYFANFIVDDLRIYNRALSPQEIRTLATRRGIAYEMAPRRKTYFIPASVLRYNLFSGSIGNTDVIGAS